MWNDLWTWADRATIIVGIVATVVSVSTWLRTTELLKANRKAAERRRAPITIRFRSQATDGAERTLDLPYRPRRDQLSRAELTGIISFYYGQARFDPGILRDLMQSGRLSEVLAGDCDGPGDELLVIDCTPEVLQVIDDCIHHRVHRPAKQVPGEDGRTFGIRITRNEHGVCDLQVGFLQPADNDQLVRDAVSQLEQLSQQGDFAGELLKIDGPCSLPVAMTIAHSVAHRFKSVAVYDPKLLQFVVSISHDPKRPIGTRIDRAPSVGGKPA